eukprot:CFRG5293T1
MSEEMRRVSTGLIHQLEEASAHVLSSETPKSSREAAEKLFLDFRQYEGALKFAETILETTSVPYVQFETAVTIKICLAREWDTLDSDSVCDLTTNLLCFIVQRPNLAVYVRKEILHAVAMAIKLGWAENEKFRTLYYTNLNHLLHVDSTGEITYDESQTFNRTIAGYFALAVFSEFSCGPRSSQVGLSWDFHRKAKMKFEGEGLKTSFSYTLKLLHAYMQQSGSEATNELLALFLSVAEAALSWRFAQSSEYDCAGYADRESSADTHLLRPGPQWTDVFTSGEVVKLFIRIQSLCSTTNGPTLSVSPSLRARLTRHIMQCLVQLGGLDGKVFPSVHAKLMYYSLFTTLLVEWINASGLLSTAREVSETDGAQMYAIATAANRLATCFFTFETIDINSVHGVYGYIPDLNTLLHHMALLSTVCLKNAQTESCGETFSTEAFDQLLDAWVTLLSDQQFPKQSVMDWTFEIFKVFVDTRVHSEMRTTVEDADDEYFEEEDDVINLDDQNLNMATLARLNSEKSITYLSTNIQRKVIMLRNTSEGLPVLGALHQLILIAGYVVADPEDKGETPTIPEDVFEMVAAHTQSGSAANSVTNPDSNADPLLLLFQSIWLYMDFENECIVNGFQHQISPLTATTLMWYLSRWASTYLLISPDSYRSLPPVLLTQLGKGSDLGLKRFNWIMDKIILNLTRWYAEPDLTKATSNLLLTLCQNSMLREQVCQCPAFSQLLSLFNTGMNYSINFASPSPQLPSNVQRKVAQAITMATASNQEVFLQFIKDLLHPWVEQTLTVCNTSTAKLAGMAREGDNDALNVIITLVDLLRGVIEGVQSSTASIVFQTISHLSDPISKLLQVYNHYPDAVGSVLKLYCSLVEHMVQHLDEREVGILYHACLTLIKTYSSTFSHKAQSEREVITFRSRNAHSLQAIYVGEYSCKYQGAAGVETAYDDLLLLMYLLTNLITRDFLDFQREDPGQSEVRVHMDANSISVCDVVLYGLGVVVPLMSKELLKFPALCSQYYKLVAFMSEVYPRQVLSVSPAFFHQLGQSFQLAILCDYGVPVARSGYEAIGSLAVYCCEAQQKGETPAIQPDAQSVLANLLRVILDTVMFRTFDSTLSTYAAEALLALIMSYQAEFMSCAQEVIQSVPDPANSQRVAEAFNKLMTGNGLTLKIERANSIRFSKNLQSFLAVVRGILVRK